MAVSYAFEHNADKASEYERRAFDLQYNWKNTPTPRHSG